MDSSPPLSPTVVTIAPTRDQWQEVSNKLASANRTIQSVHVLLADAEERVHRRVDAIEALMKRIADKLGVPHD